MSNLEASESKLKEKLDKMNKNPFFTFSKPYLDFIGQGKIFSVVYFVMAAISLIIPFAVIFATIDSGVFRYGAKFVFATIFSWLVIAFACWIGFQLWWDRRTKVTGIATSDFIATPIFSEIFQTFGEWLGTLIGIIGAGVGLIALIFIGNDASYLFSAIGLDFLNFGVMVIIIGPIIGFFIIILFRFIAEQLRLLASLVNNTKEIANNLRDK
jgi:MFS family permease